MPAVLEGDRLRQRRRVAGQHRLGSLPAPCGVTASLATAGCQASAGWGRIPAVSVICMPPFCEGGRVETKRGPCRSRREPAMSIRLEMPVVGRRRSTRRQGKDNLTFDRLTREDGGQARSCTPPEFPNLLGGARFRGKVAATSGLTARKLSPPHCSSGRTALFCITDDKNELSQAKWRCLCAPSQTWPLCFAMMRLYFSSWRNSSAATCRSRGGIGKRETAESNRQRDPGERVPRPTGRRHLRSANASQGIRFWLSPTVDA